MWVMYNYLIVGVTVVVTVWLLSVLNYLKFLNPRTGLFVLINTILLGSIFVLFEETRLYITIVSFVFYVLTAHLILRINIFKSVLGVGLVFILTAFGELLSYEVLVNVLKMNVSEGQHALYVRVIATAIDSFVVAVFVMAILFNRKLRSLLLSCSFDRKTQLWICGQIVGIFIFLCINFIYLEMPDVYRVNIVRVNIILMALFLISSLMYIMARQNLLLQYKENQQLKISLETIQELSQELRRFRHNYLNILHGLGGYIENDEWEELKKYYAEIVAESRKINNNIFSIQKIKSYALLGLLSAKIKEAQARNINIKLEVFGEIDNLEIKTSELCEVLGIYLDNAIEAAEFSQEKEIKIIFLEEDDFVTIIIENSCADVPDMSKILKGYSSKGEGRGFGLIIARQILSKYKDIVFNTYLKENNYFRQEIVIPKTNRGA